ncbi:MAG: ATP-dependent protease subunit HslV [Firmicutes bacterium ADurb.Bin153]|nr:MAG: ATP-dependent protease subunit HslV [Firmicutes bacterium ADurb.Bin153]
MAKFEGTTVVCVIREGKCAMASDGQITVGNTVMKHTAKKVRSLAGGKILAGFAGSAADSVALLEKFESKMDEFKGNLLRAATELAKMWRMDKVMRQLEALLLVTDGKSLLLLSGSGDIIEPEDGIAAIGSGGPYALAAARALAANTSMDAEEIASKALLIAADICIYTNSIITVERLG